MRRLNFTKRAMDFVKDLPPRQYKQVMSAVLALCKNPTPHDSIQLKGYDLRRQDVGGYRIVCRHSDEDLHVPLIEKRNDDAVYKALKTLSKAHKF